MPELPEVETIVRTLKPQICGSRICAVHVNLPKTLQFGKERTDLLPGARIEDVFRRAKLLLISLRLAPGKSKSSASPKRILSQSSSQLALPRADVFLAFHLKMTGRFFVHPAGTQPLRHTRLVFDLENAGRLFFDDTRTFGYCRIMLAEEFSEWPFWTSLGPEPLDMTAGELAAHFSRVFAGRSLAVKSALLDQRVVAGVGNIYADEALFLAGTAPQAAAGRIPQPRLQALAGALQKVLRQSIEECGSSIRDYRDALGNAGAFQNAFAVYGRKDKPCILCGVPLTALRVGGRSTVYCARCQSMFA